MPRNTQTSLNATIPPPPSANDFPSLPSIIAPTPTVDSAGDHSPLTLLAARMNNMENSLQTYKEMQVINSQDIATLNRTVHESNTQATQERAAMSQMLQQLSAHIFRRDQHTVPPGFPPITQTTLPPPAPPPPPPLNQNNSSGSSGSIPYSPQLPQTNSSNPHPVFIPNPKATILDFPPFDGTEVHDWVFQAENYFSTMNTPPEEQLKMASHHLKGDALKWYKVLAKKNQGLLWQWSDFARSAITRYSPKHLNDPVMEIARLRQIDDVGKYVNDFTTLYDRIDVPDSYRIDVPDSYGKSLVKVGGGGNLVDGVRRWFSRRSNTHSSSAAASSSSSSAPDTKYYGNVSINGEVDGEYDEVGNKIVKNSKSGYPQLTGVEEGRPVFVEVDPSLLKFIRVPKRNHFSIGSSMDQHKKGSAEAEFFTEYGEASRYEVQEVVGKGSYGVVGSAIDTQTGEKVAIKKINDVFEHVSDATRILREIKLLRLLRHPDIVEIKHIMLPPSRREFRDVYVVFELMESDLHQVIKANDDLTPEHYQFFLYQLLRGLKYIHAANVFHRDLKPKNILANADCKLKICDFGLARVSFNDAPSAIFWTDYVATRWYRAPELCGSFFSKYTPAIDIWSIGCIFAEMLSGKPLFPGKNVVHQLDLMTDLLGTPPVECISRIRNEKAKRYLTSMRKKPPVPFIHKFPSADPAAVNLLERLLAFDPKDRPTAEEALADPYFHGLANIDREPSTQPISKLEFEFDRRKLTKDDVRELIYREILEYHPQMMQEYIRGGEQTSFMYPSGVDRFRRQFAHLEEHYGKGEKSTPLQRQHASLPRERVPAPKDETAAETNNFEQCTPAAVATAVRSPTGQQQTEVSQSGSSNPNYSNRSLLKSASISGSQCVVVKPRRDPEEESIAEVDDEAVNDLSQKVEALHA